MTGRLPRFWVKVVSFCLAESKADVISLSFFLSFLPSLLLLRFASSSFVGLRRGNFLHWGTWRILVVDAFFQETKTQERGGEMEKKEEGTREKRVG